ncbi:sulfonate ABC transporter substrate-binding protein [Tumidithrix elongata RA019]|uniref:Putative aliphatic sulfonates-binding protein n=1 Tax=Tumidithrix elongata BACA0141 TaxID=2716417 RepID=A0AAW9Q462_9CYAN|nr:sulfonate ABC transporter substrate-binding protein [Tumidithrix elongata RA019]
MKKKHHGSSREDFQLEISQWSRRSLLKRLPFFAIGVGLSSALGACSSNSTPNSSSTGTASPVASASPSASSSPAKARVLRVGYQKSGSLNLLKHRGDFEKRLKTLGVSVTWTEFPSGPPLLEGIAVGSIDLGQTGDAPPIFSQANGAAIVYIGQSDKSPDSVGLLIPPDSDVKSVADLKGKKIAFAKGSSAHYFIVQALASAQLTLNDVTPVYLQPPDARAAFEKGDIDAWAIWAPFYAGAEKGAKAKLLVDGKGLTPFREFYLAAQSFTDKNPDLVPVIIEELQALGNWAVANPQASAEFLAEKTKVKVEILEVSERRRKGRYTVTTIQPEAIAEQQQVADTFFKAGLIPKEIKVAEAVWKPNPK